MNKPLLSLFPGAGLLDRGFEAAGYSVARGPDVVFGQTIIGYHIPPGCYEGIFGGPPCQDFSRARRRPPTGHGKAMLLEFCRLVLEGRPDWFLIENVPGVPGVVIPGYTVQRFNVLASEFGVRQRRNRAFQFGYRDLSPLILKRTLSHLRTQPAAMAGDTHRRLADLCELQGLPRNFDLPGLSRSAKVRAIGNGVPVPVATAIALSIRDRAVTPETKTCPCQCGRPLRGRQQAASAACRKRIERSRSGQSRKELCHAHVESQGPVTPSSPQLMMRDTKTPLPPIP